MTTYAGDDLYEAEHGTRFALDTHGHSVLINEHGRTVEVPVSDITDFIAEEAADAMARRIGIDGVYRRGEVDDVDLPSARATALLRALVLELMSQGDEKFREAVQDLLDWTPEITPVQFRDPEQNPYRALLDVDPELLEQDAEAPFFSETYLYNLLGKDDARTLLARMRPIWEAAGIPRKEQP